MADWQPKKRVKRSRSQVGNAIRRHRMRAGLSYRELGQRAGIPWATLRSLEIGRGRLDMAQLVLLSGVLGQKLSDEVFKLTAPKTTKAKK